MASKLWTFLNLLHWISVSAMVVLGYFSFLSMVEPRLLGIQSKHLANARGAILGGLISYIIIFVVSKVTIATGNRLSAGRQIVREIDSGERQDVGFGVGYGGENPYENFELSRSGVDNHESQEGPEGIHSSQASGHEFSPLN